MKPQNSSMEMEKYGGGEEGREGRRQGQQRGGDREGEGEEETERSPYLSMVPESPLGSGTKHVSVGVC